MRSICSPLVLASLTAAGLSLADANAYEVRTRFLIRFGDIEVVLPPHFTPSPGGGPIRLRLQMGLFDNAEGPAPAGGLGEIACSLTLQGWSANRTPGRIAPFNFGNSGNGLPAQDPFQMLTGIDMVRGPHTVLWLCAAKGVPGPFPSPMARGVNTYVSVYEITVVIPRCHATVEYTGSVSAAEWQVRGTPSLPRCDELIPGMVTYEPVMMPPMPFSALLTVDPEPYCLAEWNYDSILNSNDFFDFLADFFSNDADFNCDGATTSDDFFGFVTAFFTSSPPC